MRSAHRESATAGGTRTQSPSSGYSSRVPRLDELHSSPKTSPKPSNHCAGEGWRAAGSRVARPLGGLPELPLSMLYGSKPRLDKARALSSRNGPVNETKVSVILPIRNAAPWLRDCVESLRAQTHRDFEV